MELGGWTISRRKGEKFVEFIGPSHMKFVGGALVRAQALFVQGNGSPGPLCTTFALVSNLSYDSEEIMSTGVRKTGPPFKPGVWWVRVNFGLGIQVGSDGCVCVCRNGDGAASRNSPNRRKEITFKTTFCVHHPSIRKSSIKMV